MTLGERGPALGTRARMLHVHFVPKADVQMLRVAGGSAEHPRIKFLGAQRVMMAVCKVAGMKGDSLPLSVSKCTINT